MKLTYEAILNDPRLMDRVLAQARRERAKAAHELIILPIKRIFTDTSYAKGPACTTTSA
jgi:hypothetical protein